MLNWLIKRFKLRKRIGSGVSINYIENYKCSFHELTIDEFREFIGELSTSNMWNKYDHSKRYHLSIYCRKGNDGNIAIDFIYNIMNSLNLFPGVVFEVLINTGSYHSGKLGIRKKFIERISFVSNILIDGYYTFTIDLINNSNDEPNEIIDSFYDYFIKNKPRHVYFKTKKCIDEIESIETEESDIGDIIKKYE